MKKLLCGFALAVLLSCAAGAQQQASEHRQDRDAHGEMLGWKWANFALLVIGLGYLMAKTLPPFFTSRSEDIQKDIAEAARQKAEAEARAAQLEQRLAAIGSEIDRLRLELISEMNAEGARLKHENERMVDRVHTQAQQEIQFLIKAARSELKAFSAQLAIDSASRRIQQKMNAGTQHQLVDAFVHDLHETAVPEARVQ